MKYYNQKLFGVRKEALLRLEGLYEKFYFEDRHSKGQEDYGNEVKMREAMYAQELARIKKNIPDFENGGRVLDIGCGRGEFLSLFSKKWDKFGIEISDYAKEIAEKKGIKTEFNTEDNFFDLIIFRGTIQHIPDPIYKISECYFWLKKGGSVVFLATPNTHSIVYRLFNDLPMIDERLNFLLPSDKMLRQILVNFGFSEVFFYYPYLKTPYAKPVRDAWRFFLRLIGLRKKTDFPFYKNMMECYAKK